MALEFDISYHPAVIREDIPKIAPSWRSKIKVAIEDRLTTQPEIYGKPLRRSLKGYRKLRVGDYRVVFRIQSKKVLILAILHRSVVYKNTGKRL
jgi:mRNA interferase RelE/StbE